MADDGSRASGEVILYTAPGGVQMQLRASDGTVWLTLSELASLYATTSQNIGQIIRRILDDGEVDGSTTKSEFVVRREGTRDVRREVNLHNLDMILAVGYRVTTPRAVQFRQWATSVLREYLVKGFAMDDDKLKGVDNWDYFDEWLQRIRDIRASEKRFYQKVRDLYATAVDYEKSSDLAKTFFAKVQNKMLWAVTGHTAAEIVSLRSDPHTTNMGLTSWSGTVVRKADVAVAKNYLQNDEITELDLIVTMYLDYAELQAKNRRQMTMADWAARLDAFPDHSCSPPAPVQPTIARCRWCRQI
ncbi:RhuM family protein [Microbacterium profundi]